MDLLKGATEVKDLQLAMQKLVEDHQNMKAVGTVLENGCSSHQFYTSAVGFLSRDLPEPVEAKKVQALVERVQAENSRA